MNDVLKRVRDLIKRLSTEDDRVERIILSRLDYIYLIDDLYGYIAVDGVIIHSSDGVKEEEAQVVTKLTVKEEIKI